METIGSIYFGLRVVPVDICILAPKYILLGFMDPQSDSRRSGLAEVEFLNAQAKCGSLSLWLGV